MKIHDNCLILQTLYYSTMNTMDAAEIVDECSDKWTDIHTFVNRAPTSKFTLSDIELHNRNWGIISMFMLSHFAEVMYAESISQRIDEGYLDPTLVSFCKVTIFMANIMCFHLRISGLFI